jgi:hypothetical protein
VGDARLEAWERWGKLGRRQAPSVEARRHEGYLGESRRPTAITVGF